MTKELDTIYIELVVSAVLGNEIWMQGDIEVRIGNKKPYSEGDIVEIDSLLESMKSDGEYFIFSCCCGLPECAGWNKGIKVSHRKDTVEWVNLNNNETWVFDKETMIEDLKTIREEVAVFKQFFKTKEIDYVGVGFNW